MNRIICFAGQRAELIHGLAEHVHHAAESRTSHGNSDARAGIVRFHAANETFRRLHRDATDATLAQVLLALQR